MAETNMVGNERSMLKDQWKKEEEYEKEMQIQQFIVNRERNLELIRHNEAEQLLKDQQTNIEKTRDRGMLQATLNRESAEERWEQEQKRLRMTEVVELQKHYMQKAQDKREEE